MTVNRGGSFGGVRRYLVDDSIIGTGLWYDINESTFDNTYQQIGTTLEWFRDMWSVRANGYFPVGNRRQTVISGFRLGPTGLRYQQNNIVFGNDFFRVEEVAMKGCELEVARNFSDYDAEAYAGYYHFQAAGDQAHGFKLGARGYVSDTIATTVTVSNDGLFGANVFGGVTLFFGGSGGNRPRQFHDKLTIPVERNQLVSVNQRLRRSGSDLVVLTDPTSGLPIIVEHVDSSAPAGGDGTFENPLRSLDDVFNNSADGSTTNGNIVFVHSGSTFNGEAAALRTNQRFLGEGIVHTVNTTQLGTINLLPGNGPGTVPLIANAPVDAITLSSMGNEVSGFTITGGTRAIVRDTGATNTNINRVTIQNTAGNAIVITPSTATTINDVTFSNIGGMDIVLNATNSTLTNITSTNAMGGSIFLQNIAGTTTINNVNITGASGFGGILLDNALNGSQTTLSDVTVTGAAEGISITNSQMGSTITGNDLQIANSTGIGIEVMGTACMVSLNRANVSNSGAAGIFVQNAASFNIGVGGSIVGDGGTINGAVDDGIYVRDSNVDIRFTSISNVTDSGGSDVFDEGLGDGIRYILNTNASFTARIDNNIVSNVAGDGINAAIGQGMWTATIANNNVTASRTAIRLDGNENTAMNSTVVAIDNNMLAAGTGRGIETRGTIVSHTITSLSGNTITSAGGGGMSFSDVIFDSDTGMNGFQVVDAGTTILGSISSRLMQTAVQFDGHPQGMLTFGNLQAFTVASPTAASSGIRHTGMAEDFFLTINGGVIDITNGESFTRGIRFGSPSTGAGADGDGGLTLNNLNINLNNAPDPIAIDLQNAAPMGRPTDLSGSINTTTGVVNFSNVTGTNFNGSIMFDTGNVPP